MSGGRMLRVLPFACLTAALVLFVSELMTTFEFTPPGAEPICDQGGADRHGNALALLAVFAIGALVVTVLNGSKPAAIAVAASGGVALLFFLLLDLPDANAVGTINDSCGAVGSSFFDAEAIPQGGFFLEMIGALGLTITGVALATLTPEQLAALRPARDGGAVAQADERARPHGTHEGEPEGTRRLRSRPRSRQRG